MRIADMDFRSPMKGYDPYLRRHPHGYPHRYATGSLPPVREHRSQPGHRRRQGRAGITPEQIILPAIGFYNGEAGLFSGAFPRSLPPAPSFFVLVRVAFDLFCSLMRYQFSTHPFCRRTECCWYMTIAAPSIPSHRKTAAHGRPFFDFASSKRSLWLFCHITRFSKDNTQHNHVSGSESSSQGSRSGMGQ